ncbi:PREDICTED: activating signal cointegrator 1 isoform X4 [Polistes dominula]|uniref:Activating signal cointegrator 1 isoform X4 n=1 Tax=Polistes dominula TaxID=743375 RepID=A0ABM1IHC2_POLDO|nr:PREDICTED: activating signal cointegrator 1 isoform X4 [Polistes dominula]
MHSIRVAPQFLHVNNYMIMEEWIYESLSGLLDFPVPEELIQFIIKIRNERDLDEYLTTLLDLKNPKHKQFIAELKKRQASCNDPAGYKKTNDNNDDCKKKQNDKKKNKTKGKENIQVQEMKIDKIEKIEKKKPKFVNLYSQEGRDRETVLLKGRHKCDCEAKKHSLINNCNNCGRIVCYQEGSGPCFFCGTLVCSREQQAILSSNTKQADDLYNKLMDRKPNKGLEESIKQRDKLLEYDRNSARRTKVIDDESDYFQTNSTWLTSAEREKFRKREEEISAQKHASRLSRKVTLDFIGREVFVGQEENNELDDLYELTLDTESINSNISPNINFDSLTYIKQETMRSVKQTSNIIAKSKIQDKEYLELTDQGLCLSMHQPYASLLVAGIKLHEGRTWYSSHRGRLWIASTAKTPTAGDISEIEHFYRILKNEQYREMYPEGESESPYVFICENSYTLPIKFPIQGKHKIYKLDNKIHQAAMKSLDKVIKEKKE